MNFVRLRSKYYGPINKLSYFGMLGDVAVFTGLFVFYKLRKARQASQEEANKEIKRQQNL